MDFERTKRRVHEVNLTPLIDIVFHLMVFVMLTTSFVVVESMELSLPSFGKASASAGGGPLLRVQIEPDGQVIAEGARVPMAELNQVLAAKLGDAPETKIVVFTAPGVKVQQLVNVLDIVYLTGGRDVQVDKAS